MNGARVLAAVLLTVLSAACGAPNPAPESTGAEPATSTSAAVTPGVNATDRAFAYGLLAQRPQIEHMVALAHANSDNPAVTGAADALATSEKQQSDTVNALLVQWTDGEEGGQGPPPEGGPTLFDRGALERLGSLRGPEFDKLWLQAMLNHHQAVMVMASSEIRDGEDVNAKTLAQAIIETRQAETAQMQQILGGLPR